ncbi:hypothetical protein [Pseudorhodoplanes sp.]|uniref:hypothetical protein n=1 Tax=Pseudorhodoplanes sp. TaxID=1934341 RepID=UPI002B6E8854|nr:hypothetical protein [Pseudorhodoplanes sp.]HWV41317.1 hypothetical protein [Pseudorhodoplanes sp.]
MKQRYELQAINGESVRVTFTYEPHEKAKLDRLLADLNRGGALVTPLPPADCEGCA